MATENVHGDGNGEGNEKTIFVDTSLDTRLVAVVSDSDTVSSCKRKIMEEHRQCFPAIGDISIHSLKVKRKGILYHLPDAMLVKSSFLASQKNWFLSVDASPLQHNPGPTDQIPLPGVHNSPSIVTTDSQADRSPKLCLIYGSPLKHLKIAPFVNQNAPTVDHFTSDDNLRKKVSKNSDGEKSSHDEHRRNLGTDLEQQLDSKVEEKVYTVNKEKQSKKRIRHVHNEDASVKKKRCKTRRVEGDIRGSEEDRVLTDDIGKVNDMGTSEDVALDAVVTKAMDDEDTRTILVSHKKQKRTKKGKSSAHDQVATVVPSTVKEVGEEIHLLESTEASEVIPDVAMVVAKNIQQETPVQSSQKEKGNELVQDADIGNGVPSSLMSKLTVFSEGVTAEEELLVRHADDLVDMSLTVPTPVFDEKTKDKSKSEDAALDVVVTKATDDEHTRTILVSQKKQKRTKKGKSSAHYQVATVVPSTVKEVGEEIHPLKSTEASEAIPAVAMVVAKNIQQETPGQSSQKEKGNELVQDADIGNGVPSSLMKGVTAEEELLVRHADDLVDMSLTVPTPVSDEKTKDKSKSEDAALDVVVTKATDDENTRTILVSQKKKQKRTKKSKSSAHDQVATVPPSSVKDVREGIHPSENTEASNVIPHDAMIVETDIQQEIPVQSFQNEKGNEPVQEADIGNEVPSSSMKGVTAEEELLVRHADDLVDSSLTVSTPVFDEKIKDKSKSERTKKGNSSAHDQVAATVVPSSVKDVREEIHPSENTEASNVNPDVAMVAETYIQQEMHVQSSQKETSNELVQEADIGNGFLSSSMKGATAEEELPVKHADDLVDMSLTIPTPVFDEKVIDEQQKYKANVDHGRNDHNLDNEAEISKIETIASQLIAEIPEKQNENMGDTKKKSKRNRKTKESTARKEGENGDLLEKIADVSQEELEPEKSKAPEETMKNVTVFQVPKGNDEGIADVPSKLELETEISKILEETTKNMTISQVPKGNDEGIADVPSKLELEPEISKISEETTKNLTVSQVPKGNDEGIADVPSKLELEPEISKIPEETTKNVTVSQVPKGNDVNYDVGTPQEGAREIDFMDHFLPDKQLNDSAIYSPSRNENKKDLLSSKKIPKVFADGVGVKDRNAPSNAKVKTPKRTTNIDAPKTSKPAQINKPQPSSKSGSSSESFVRSSKSQKITNQQPTMGQTQVKNLKKSVSGVKRLLNTHETIFGDNSDDSSANDDATINSDSSTHTPLGTSSSSSLESDSSADMRRVKRKEAAGKNNTNSQSRLKNMSMVDLLRSSSRFKKARVAASQRVNDTESEPVDFVPESYSVS